jgi:hypothetical protein
MTSNIKYALLTSTFAYAVAAIMLTIFFTATGFSGGYFGRDLVTGLTLMLSEFGWWGEVFYLAVIIPWLGSAIIMTLLLTFITSEAGRRRLFGGISIAVYYVAMILVFAIGRTISAWGNIDINPGDIGYLLLLIWPAVGFVIGYIVTTAAESIVKLGILE